MNLLRAEISRLLARRFVRVLVLLGLVGYVIVVVTVAVNSVRPTADDLAAAEAVRDQELVNMAEFYEQCANDPARPPEVPLEDACGPEPTAENFPVSDFLPKRPFTLEDGLPDGVVGFAVATAAFGFLLGATAIGVEWSTRSIVALLFWEPRRLRVILTKFAVVGVAAAALAVLTQAAWFAAAQAVARTRGTTSSLAAGFYSDVLAQQARSIVLVVLVAWIGFAIAGLIRNTGASLGVGFVYFALIENAVRGLRPRWQEWLIVDNAIALVLEGGHTIPIYDDQTQTQTELVLSNLHGGLVLLAVTGALTLAGTVLFMRRDLH